MSVYENVIGGTLKLKGKALDVKAGGIKKKKRKTKQHYYDKGKLSFQQVDCNCIVNDAVSSLFRKIFLDYRS